MHVFTADSEADAIRNAIAAGDPFWLDLPRDRFDADNPAAAAVGIDASTLAFLEARGDRPGAYVDQGRTAIVFSGATLDDDEVRAVDVIVLAGANALVTLRDDACAPLDNLRDAAQTGRRHADALAAIDALTDSLLGVAEQMEGVVDTLENTILSAGSRDLLMQITRERQKLSVLLRIARAQRGMVIRNEDELVGVPIAYGVAERRVRDVVAHLALATDQAEATRMTIAEALNLYLTNAAESLTRVATVMLPLTVVTGFFGMNFGWMVDHVDTFWSFVVFGLGTIVLAVLAVQLYLRRKGYG